MTEIPKINVYDGKYTLIMDPSNLRALRYGEPWRDLIGDGFVMALGQEILDLRAEVQRLKLAATTPDHTTEHCAPYKDLI